MKRSAVALAAVSMVISALPAIAGPDCKCRANGEKFEIGQIACIRLPAGSRLAQCGMVLNNTSWKILAGSCPSARLDSGDDPALMSVSPHNRHPAPAILPGDSADGHPAISISG